MRLWLALLLVLGLAYTTLADDATTPEIVPFEEDGDGGAVEPGAEGEDEPEGEGEPDGEPEPKAEGEEKGEEEGGSATIVVASLVPIFVAVVAQVL